MDQTLPVAQKNRDIVVIGASAGGLAPLMALVGDLPEGLRAAVFVVVHVGARSHLARVLSSRTALPVCQAENGAQPKLGHIYVAGPGRHLLLHDNHILLRRGPRENLTRPAIDPLFRSAACTFGGRVIGVILSGALNDGTAGLRAIKAGGGLAVIQDPQDAAVSDMPQSALRFVEIDHAVPASQMGSLIIRLVAEPADETLEVPVDVRIEAAISAQEVSSMRAQDELGTPAPFSCPECNGTLWELADGNMLRYRCHVGHAYTADVLLAAQTEQVELKLWSMLRSHEERAELVRRLASRERARNRDSMAADLQARAEEYEQDAELIRSLLRDREPEILPQSTEGPEFEEGSPRAPHEQEEA